MKTVFVDVIFTKTVFVLAQIVTYNIQNISYKKIYTMY